MTLLAITLALITLAILCDDALLLAVYELCQWRQRQPVQRHPHVVKPLTPLQRALIAERAAALNDPVGKDTHDPSPLVTDLRDVSAVMRRAS